jgi:hypothetical protein
MNGFDVVEVGVGEEGAVVAGVVVGSFAGRAERGVAGVDARLVEAVDGGVVGGGEGEVDILGGLTVGEGEAWWAASAEGDAVRPSSEELEADDGCERRVELSSGVEVADAEPDVVDRAALGPGVVVVDGFDAVPAGSAMNAP